MIKELQKGNKSPYHGYLLGIQEYQEYQRYKKIAPQLLKQVQECREVPR